MIRNTHRNLARAAVAGCMVLAAQFPAQASPLSDVFHETVPLYESFNVNVDAFDEALWSATDFSEQEIWEIILHSALAAGNSQFEAVAQAELARLGVSETQMDALYRLDPSLGETKLALLTFAQRSGVLPTRVNASDIAALRRYYDDKEMTDILVINAYFNMYNVLYGSGYVAGDSPVPFPDLTANLTANLTALGQEKITSPDGWIDRQYFESPALEPDLTLPYLKMDQSMLIEPHAFTPVETWEMFVVGQRASDCRHCIAHGAFGMHLEYADNDRIIAAYTYDGTGYAPRDKARLDFVQAAMQLPSAVTETQRAALSVFYSEQETHELVALTTYMALLSTYMQISGVVTDTESATFAIDVLGPEGFTLGRHVGPPQEQRKMNPVTMYRLTKNAPEETRDIDRLLLWMDNTVYTTMRHNKFRGLPGPALQALLEILVLVALVVGWRRVTSNTRNRKEV